MNGPKNGLFSEICLRFGNSNTKWIFVMQVFIPQCGNFMIFSITHILREIKFEDSRSAKSAVFKHLEALNFDIYAFFSLL